MMKRQMWIFMLAMLMASPMAIATENDAAETEQENASRTHIEWSPGGLIKIEIPRIPLPRKSQEGKRLSAEGNILGVIQVSEHEHDPYLFAQIGVMKIPFMKTLMLSEKNVGKLESPGGVDEEGNLRLSYRGNPFDRILEFDQPFLSVWDFAVLKKIDPDQPEDKRNDYKTMLTVAKRRRLIDSLVFGLYQRDDWGDASYEERWLQAPLFKTWSRRQSEDKDHFKLADTPFGGIVSYEKNHDSDHARMHILNLLLVQLYNGRWSPEESNWKFLDNMLGSVVESRKKGDESRLRVLDLPFVEVFESESEKDEQELSLLDIWVLGHVYRHEIESDGESERVILETPVAILPDFLRLTLWKSEYEADGEMNQRLLSLPLVGPVWGRWREDADATTHQTIFPRLHFWNTPKEVH